jgi:hypothetical protein
MLVCKVKYCHLASAYSKAAEPRLPRGVDSPQRCCQNSSPIVVVTSLCTVI